MNQLKPPEGVLGARPRVTHDYKKFDDPWDDEDEQSNQTKEDNSLDEKPDEEDPLMRMTLAERVYHRDY